MYHTIQNNLRQNITHTSCIGKTYGKYWVGFPVAWKVNEVTCTMGFTSKLHLRK